MGSLYSEHLTWLHRVSPALKLVLMAVLKSFEAFPVDGNFLQAISQMLADSLAQPAAPIPHETLSEREMQTLLKIASGQKQTDIAQELMLSPKTVSVYRARVLEKLGMSSNAELTAYAIHNKLI